MKEQAQEEAKKELQVEFDKQLADEVAKVKEETSLQIEKLKAEYDTAIAEAKLEQASNLQAAIEQAQQDAQDKIEQATSWQAIEEKRQEEVKKDPSYSEQPKEESNAIEDNKNINTN